MKNLLLGLVFLLSSLSVSADYSEHAHNLALDFLDALVEQGKIQKLETYQVKAGRFYRKVNGEKKKFISRMGLMRIAIPGARFLQLTPNERIDFVHILKIHTRPEKDTYEGPENVLVEKYIGAGNERGKIIVFSLPKLKTVVSAFDDYIPQYGCECMKPIGHNTNNNNNGKAF